LNNVLTWTPVGNVTSYTHTLSNPIYDQVYHVSLRVINGAGLNSLFVSNGQRLVDGSTIGLPHHDLAQILVYPNPATSNFSIEGLEGVYGLTVYDASGKLIMNEEFEQSIQIECTNWSAGIYQLVIKQGNSFILKKLVIE
jgi:hypothetical protein